MESQVIELYSLDPREKGWELLCYQSPQPLYFENEQWLGLLEAALHECKNVRVCWDPESGRILSVERC